MVNDKRLKEYSRFLREAVKNGLGFIFDFKKAAIAVPMPKFWKDEKRQLHREIGPAVIWHDGFEEHYLFGIRLEKDLWEKIVKKSIPVKEAILLPNAEHRRLAMKYIGGQKLFEECGGKIKSQDEHGFLIELDLKDTNGNNYVFFKGFDPADNDYCYLRVSPNTKTPQEAMTRAYKLNDFGLEYKPASRT